MAEENIAELEQKNKRLSDDKATVEWNMSSLLKTAKAEILRKNNQIKDLRQE